MAIEYSGRPSVSPTPMTGNTNQIDQQVAWQQLCYISADMRNLLAVSKTNVELMKTMSEQQQKTTECIARMDERLDATLDKLDVMLTGIGNLMIATQVLIEKMTELIDENEENTHAVALDSRMIQLALLDENRMKSVEKKARQQVSERRAARRASREAR